MDVFEYIAENPKRFEANVCKKCGKTYYPKRKICECGSKEFTVKKLPSEGEILGYTIVKTTPSRFSPFPYVVGEVRLSDGTVVKGQIVDFEENELKEGAKVVATLRVLLDDGRFRYYTVKFRRARNGDI